MYLLDAEYMATGSVRDAHFALSPCAFEILGQAERSAEGGGRSATVLGVLETPAGAGPSNGAMASLCRACAWCRRTAPGARKRRR